MPYSDIYLPEVVPIFSNTFGAPEGGCVQLMMPGTWKVVEHLPISNNTSALIQSD
jgi:hypothetical protein